MPNFDGGHYFLTAFLPIRTRELSDREGFTSPVHALRKVLAQWPGTPTLAFETRPSPFARNKRLHFARLVIIDDVAYNGRLGRDTILGKIGALRDPAANNPVIAQPQDHLLRPYLMIAMDFDAADGNPASRDAFLSELWREMGPDLQEILRFCVGFDKKPATDRRFADYIAACQIETTMPFNDYYIDPSLALPVWPFKWFTISGGVGALAFFVGAFLLFIALDMLIFGAAAPRLAAIGITFFLAGAAVLGMTVLAASGSISRFGGNPFPFGPSLAQILKALHVQRAFTRFAIDNQRNSAPGSESALHEAFAAFLAAERPSSPHGPTQAPGGLGI